MGRRVNDEAGIWGVLLDVGSMTDTSISEDFEEENIILRKRFSPSRGEHHPQEEIFAFERRTLSSGNLRSKMPFVGKAARRRRGNGFCFPRTPFGVRSSVIWTTAQGRAGERKNSWGRRGKNFDVSPLLRDNNLKKEGGTPHAPSDAVSRALAALAEIARSNAPAESFS